jgi:hypothetical protein
LNIEKQKIYSKWSLGLMMVLGSIFLLYLNWLVPYLPGDDHIFQMKIPNEGIIGQERITSISDLIESQVNFYNNYHYRVLNHTLLQLLLLLPTWVFDVLNVLVYLLLPFSVLARKEQVVDYGAKYVFLLFFIWVFHFDLGRCYFLTTGALNYSWLLVPQLLYVRVLLRYLEKGYSSPWLVVLAMANFNSNENVQVVLFVLSLYVLSKTKRKTVILSTAILLFGGLWMLASPSVGSRLAEQGFREGGWLPHVIEYAKRAVYFGLQYWPIVLLTALAAGRIGPPERQRTYILLGGATFSMFVMVGIPLFEPRSAIFGFFLALMWLGFYTSNLRLPKTLFYAMILLGTVVGILRLPDFQAQRARHNANLALLINNEKDIYLKPYCDQIQRSYLLCYPLSEDPNFVDNKSLAAVYGKHSVQQRVRQLPDYKLADLSSTRVPELFYAQQGQTLDVFVEGESKTENYYYIIRGSRKGLNSHRLIDFIPEQWRLFFLDYLEDVTSSEMPYATIEGQRYPHLEIDNYTEYKYFLISAYDLRIHDRVGEIMRLELAEIQ